MGAEHMRPEGLSQGYYCFTCGNSCNMYATGHGPGKCTPNPELVKELVGLNRQESDRYTAEETRRREQSRFSQRGDQQQPAVDRDKQTAGGKWIKRDKDVHRCSKPTYAQSPGVKTGDLWECGTCHKVWRVTGTDSGDQRDPYPTQLRWVENTNTRHGVYDR